VSDARTPVNRLGLPLDPYKGAASTLCPGCGHDAITGSLIRTLWEMDIPPHLLAKMSGIGCSSKTTAYFGAGAWGFNAVHGRMPSVATGALLANRHLRTLGVSGDGDTASIGIGQFVHLVRRNLPMVYVVENNGVYGLTKGQFSATADRGSRAKKGAVNVQEPIDLCGLALELGCGFVARGFSADKKQLDGILKAAFAYRGTAVVDIVSPCVAFNNHAGSTRSYDYGKEHDHHVVEVGFVPAWDPAPVEVPPGGCREVEMPDGSRVLLVAVEEAFDTTDRDGAIARLRSSRRGGELLTGIFHLATGVPTFEETLELVAEPLAFLPGSRLRPPPGVLEAEMRALM